MSVNVLDISFYNNTISSRPYAEILIGLKKKGINVSALTNAETFYAQKFAEKGMKVIDFQIDKKLDMKTIRKIRQAVIDNDIQILQLGSSKSIMNGILAAMGLPVKVVLYRGYTGNIHWYDPTAYLKFLSPRVDCIVSIAEATRDLIRDNLFFNKEKSICIRKGHHPDWYKDIPAADLSDFGVKDGDFTAICVANSRRMKDVPSLIRATHHLPKDMPFHLFLVGNGMDAPKIQKEIDASPFKDRIHQTGFRKDALEIVKACDVFTLSSIKGEAITKAVIEAMSLGTAPIITDIPGNRSLVNDGEQGLVVPMKNPKAMAEALTKLWKDPELCKKYGNAAQKHMQENFHISRSIEEYEQLFKKLAAE